MFELRYSHNPSRFSLSAGWDVDDDDLELPPDLDAGAGGGAGAKGEDGEEEGYVLLISSMTIPQKEGIVNHNSSMIYV